MILLLGAANYLGQAFARALRASRAPFVPLSREALDFGSFDILFDYLRHLRPSFVINAESYLPEHVSLNRPAMYMDTVLLAETVARACHLTNTPFAHLSCGGVYSGARLLQPGGVTLCPDLSFPNVLAQFYHEPDLFRGFPEYQPATLTFSDAACPLASGVAALAEEKLKAFPNAYIWRLRLLFDNSPAPWNLLHRLTETIRLPDAINSVSHLGDAVNACLELHRRQAPYGTYHIANPGPVTYRQVVGWIRRIRGRRDPERHFPDTDFSWAEPAIPECHCILDTSKLQAAGIRLRTAEAAIHDALNRWPLSRSDTPAPLLFKGAPAS